VRLLAFVAKTPGLNPGQRFRLEQWKPHLAARHGIEIDFLPFESPRLTEILYRHGLVAQKASLMLRDYVRRAWTLPRARKYDGAVIYREVAALGPAVFERVLSALDVPFILDFDDAIWMSTATGGVNGRFAALKFPGKTRTATRLAAAVTVGNHYLADWARAFNDNVHVVPTSIDLGRYEVQPELETDAPFVIGWMGSHSTRVYLEQVREAIERFGKTRNVRVTIVCDRPIERPFANTETTFVPWRGDREAADIGQMHVGIMPLTDDEYSKGKCGCKALQYMAAGRPAVVSPVGVNVDIIQHGTNGFLAESTDAWVSAFETLAISRDVRRRIAGAARRTVEESFSAVASADRFADAARSAIRRNGRSRAAPLEKAASAR
jgi:glycosyltransferase involved in cell wall biosynthesis